MLKNYRELRVWQWAYRVCTNVYRITLEFPKDEVYGLTAQMRRAAVSIPSNIAEGYGRGSTGDYVRFLHMAHGSLCELETQTMIAAELGYVKEPELDVLQRDLGSLERMLMALIRSLEKKRGQRVMRAGPESPDSLTP